MTTPSIVKKLYEIAGTTYNVSESNDSRQVSLLNNRPHERFTGGLNHQLASNTLKNLGHNAPSAASSTTASHHTDSTNVISLRGGKKIRTSIYVNDEDDEKMSSIEAEDRSSIVAKTSKQTDKGDDAVSVLTVPMSTYSGDAVNVVGATRKEVITEYIRRLTLIYGRFQPKFIAHIPTMLKQSLGKEHEMYVKVCRMYNLPVEREWVIVEKENKPTQRQKTPSITSSHNSPSSSRTHSPARQVPSFRNRGRTSPSPQPRLHKAPQFIQTSRPSTKGLSLKANGRPKTVKIPSRPSFH